jgi:hypothetical protein
MPFKKHQMSQGSRRVDRGQTGGGATGLQDKMALKVRTLVYGQLSDVEVDTTKIGDIYIRNL